MNRGKNTTIVSSAVIVLGVVLIVVLVWYVLSVKRQTYADYKVATVRAQQAYDSIKQRYKYMQLPNGEKNILAPDSYTYNNPSGTLVLVNKTHPLSLDYKPPQLVSPDIPVYQNDATIVVDARIKDPLQQLYEAAEKDGIQLFIRSAYRSSQDQQFVFAEAESGTAAVPGQSEHQTGLAVDFNSGNAMCGDMCSLSAPAAAWLEKHGPEYGFVQRYTSSKQQITGYLPENWHYRYVGIRIAQLLVGNNLSYEELYPLFTTAKERQ